MRAAQIDVEHDESRMSTFCNLARVLFKLDEEYRDKMGKKVAYVHSRCGKEGHTLN